MTIDLKKLFGSGEKPDKFQLTLLKALKENASKDFDYLKFKQSLRSLEELDIEEETRFKSAFATATTMGVTKNTLINSTKKYQTVLNKEKRSFAEALQNQRENRVNSKKKELQKLEEKKQATLDKIEKLKNDILLIDKKITEVNSEILGSNDKIEDTRNRFVASFDEIMETLQKDLELMNEYL